jgi:hypothetical protein
MARDTYEPPPLAPDGVPVLVPEVQRRFDQLKSRECGGQLSVVLVLVLVEWGCVCVDAGVSVGTGTGARGAARAAL